MLSESRILVISWAKIVKISLVNKITLQNVYTEGTLLKKVQSIVK